VSRSDQQRVEDMLMAAEEIAAVVGRGRPLFDRDVAFRRAIERSLEIVGEAAKSLSAEFAEAHPGIPISDLAKVRDRISHHYHRVDPNQLWNIAAVDIPPLVSQLRVISFDR